MLFIKLSHHKIEVLCFGQLSDIVLIDELLLISLHRRVEILTHQNAYIRGLLFIEGHVGSHIRNKRAAV
jgi:hypothetical protein